MKRANFKELGWRFKLPGIVLLLQALAAGFLMLFFSSSHAPAVRWAFVLVLYPFIRSAASGIVWLAILFTIGTVLDNRAKSRLVR